MTALEFFTVTAHLQSVNVDYVDIGDVPDVQDISSTVTFIPRLPNGALIWAPGLTVPSGVALSPIVARTDTDGILRTIQSVAVDEQQTLTLTGPPTSFTLTFAGQTTAAIATPAAASLLTTRLTALSNIGAGNVTVVGSTGGPYVVSFVNSLGHADQPQMTGTPTGGGSVVVTTTRPGTLAAGVQLVANTSAIDLGVYDPATGKGGLVYDVVFDNVVFNKKFQTLSPFAFEAPTTGGVTIDLASVNKLDPKLGL